MHVLINVKSSNNISKWQMGFNSAFKGLTLFWKVIAPYYENKKSTNMLCGRNARILNVAHEVVTVGEEIEYTPKLAP
jgi:hypothetical protein